jgi:DNA polymerase (family 10)
VQDVTNAEIADAFEELGVLYELDGAVKYRVLAYGAAAKAIRESPVSVADLAAADRATELPGVGKTLAEKIDALLETGEIPAAAKLKAKFPPSLIEVTHVPGVGAKTARRLFEELGVADLDDLKRVAEEKRIRGLRGLGAKVEENVLAALERLGEPGGGPGRVLLSMAPSSSRRSCASTRPPTGSRWRARCAAGRRPARTST